MHRGEQLFQRHIRRLAPAQLLALLQGFHLIAVAKLGLDFFNHLHGVYSSIYLGWRDLSHALTARNSVSAMGRDGRSGDHCRYKSMANATMVTRGMDAIRRELFVQRRRGAKGNYPPLPAAAVLPRRHFDGPPGAAFFLGATPAGVVSFAGLPKNSPERR